MGQAFVSPFRLAQAAHDAEASIYTFYEVLLIHLESAYVFSGPGGFIMGRPVRTDALIDEILDPSKQFENPNAWWVWLAAGHGALAIFLRHEPFPLPYYGFERDHIPRFYRREQLRRYVKHHRQKQNPPAHDGIQRYFG